MDMENNGKEKRGPLTRKLKRNLVAPKRRGEDKMRSDNVHSNLDAQGRTAIKALQSYYNEQKKQSKSALFPEIDFTLHLLAVYKKAARVNANNNMSAHRKIQLPYPLQSPETSTICLIVRDLHMKDKDYNDPDVDKQAREWQEKLLREQDITGAQITKILTRRQLEREYHTYTDKRSLASAYDLFLVDNTVMKVVHDMCGKEFHKANKYPIAVKTNRPLTPQIGRAFRTTLLPLYKLKNRVIKIGHLGQPLDELAKNLNECIIQLRSHCPGGTDNIQALYLQPTSSSPSLPIYVDLGSRNEVSMETPKEHKQRLLEEKKHPGIHNISGELSTLPDGLDKVIVHPDGRVRVIKDGKEVMFPTMDDEQEERDDILPSKKTRRSAEAIAKKSAFHRAAKRAIWKSTKEAKGEKTALKNGRLTADEKDAAQFKFRPVVKIGKSKKAKSAENGAETPSSPIQLNKRKRGKNASAKAAAVSTAPDSDNQKTTSPIPPPVAPSPSKKRKATASAP